MFSFSSFSSSHCLASIPSPLCLLNDKVTFPLQSEQQNNSSTVTWKLYLAANQKLKTAVTHTNRDVNVLYYIWRYLVLVQLTVLIFLLSLLLECYNDETNEDVHHEEGNDDNVDDEEDGDDHTVVVDGADVLSMRVYGLVQ